MNCMIIMKGRQGMNNMVSNISEVSNKRKYFVDNIRWVTVIVVLIYHVFYMYNAEGISGGPAEDHESQSSVLRYIYVLCLSVVYAGFVPGGRYELEILS